MTEFNDVYNISIKRLSFWHKLSAYLALTEKLVNNGEHLSREDKRVLRKIHLFLSRSYKISERQRDYHSRQLRQV